MGGRRSPDKSVVGYPLVRKRLAGQEVAIVVVNKAIFAHRELAEWLSERYGDVSSTERLNHYQVVSSH